jgi:hypothetical protein
MCLIECRISHVPKWKPAKVVPIQLFFARAWKSDGSSSG